MTRKGSPSPIDLHPRIAAALGWTEQDTRSFTLAALREVVRPVSLKLAHEISVALKTGEHVVDRGRRQ